MTRARSRRPSGRALAHLLYSVGIVALALVGFFSPLWFLGFLPLGAGFVWAAYDLVEVTPDGQPPTAPQF
jgi:hypothetical protein